jgi:hypothetical protein
MATRPQNQPPNESRWWILIDNRPEGPHGSAYLSACLSSGQIGGDALVCPEGTQEWRPIAAWPQLATGLSGSVSSARNAPPAPPSGIPSRKATDVGVLMNPSLPPMANWICSYCIAISPTLWIIQNMSCCVAGFTFHANSDFLWLEIILQSISTVVSLAVTITLAIGGLKLRDLKRSGIQLVMLAIWAAIAAGAVNLIAWVLLAVIAGMSETNQFAEQNTAADIITFILLVVGVCELAFMVVSLVWLYRNKNKLALVA